MSSGANTPRSSVSSKELPPQLSPRTLPAGSRRKSVAHTGQGEIRFSLSHAHAVAIGNEAHFSALSNPLSPTSPLSGKQNSVASLTTSKASIDLKENSTESVAKHAIMDHRSVPQGSGFSTPRQSLKGQLPEMFSLSSAASAWVPVELDSFGQPIKPRDRSSTFSVLEDRKMLAELSQTMAGQLNEMYAFMHQAMTKERARHSSDVSLILRKVEKDLRETFDNVRNTFATLTDQLMILAKEVEVGRAQVTNVQSKHLRTKEAVEAQAQYVTELEAVLDSQQSGTSGKLKQLSSEAQDARVALKKAEESSNQRDKACKEEISMLRKSLAKYESAENMNSLPPPLKEMPATWTQQTSDGEGTGEQPGASEIMKSVIMHCDSGRQVPRLKQAFRGKPAKLPSLPVQEPPPAPSPAKDEVRRANLAEARCARMHRYVTKAYPPLCLLSDVFAVLRASGCFGVVSVGDDGLDLNLPEDADAHAILSRIARLFCISAPKLRGLSDLLVAVGGEATRPPPEGLDPKIVATVAEEPTPFDQKRAAEEEIRLISTFHQPSASALIASKSDAGDLSEGLVGLGSRAGNEGFPKSMSSPSKRPAMQMLESFAEDDEEEEDA